MATGYEVRRYKVVADSLPMIADALERIAEVLGEAGAAMMTTDHMCPRCGGGIPNDAMRGQYPGAVSRWDNKTEICSMCGQEEAMTQFFKGHGELHPVTGALKWVDAP